MKYAMIFSLMVICFACSTPDYKSHPQEKSDTLTIHSGLATQWKNYIDTVNLGFIISFKYPNDCIAEHFENSECIGKPIKMIDDGPSTSMDCSIWMSDARDSDNIQPIDTLIKYQINSFKKGADKSVDSITIANVKGLKVVLSDKNDKSKILKQIIYFTKYDSFFEVINDRLSEESFKMLVNTIKVAKSN